MDYFGLVMEMFPMVLMDVSKVERTLEQELIEIEKQNGFNLREYQL